MMRIKQPDALGEVLGNAAVAKAMAERRERLREAAGFAHARGEGFGHGQVDLRWFALETANRSEKSVEKLLADERLDVLLPMRRTLPKRRGCRPASLREAVDVPLFPGYVFACFAACNEAFARMLRIDGVRGVVNSGGKPLAICEKDIKDLKALSESGWFDQTHQARTLRRGQNVMIKEGPLEWVQGSFEGYVGTAHVRVLATLMGRAVPVKVELAHLEW